MKRLAFIFTLACFATISLIAQNKPLDHSVYDGWQSVTAVKLSADGGLLSYEIVPQEGDGTLFVKNLGSGAELAVERGTGLKWAGDASWAVFTVKAPFDSTRQAKIDKKGKDDQPKDSLARLNLRTLKWEMIGESGTNAMGLDAAPYIFAAQEVKGRKSKKLLVIDTATGAVDSIMNVSTFEASKDGKRLVAALAKEDTDSLSQSAVVVYEFATARIDTLDAQRKTYANVRFNESGNKIVFTATDQEEKNDGTPRHAVYVAQEEVLVAATRRTPAVTKWQCAQVLAPDSADLPDGWVVSAAGSPRFSNDAGRLVLTLSEYFPAKDTTVYEFEAAQLDIWVWDKHTVPPMDKVGRPRTRTAVINLDQPGRLIPVASNPSDRISFFNGATGNYALSMDTDKYVIDNMWASDSKADIYLVNLRDGSRKLLRKEAEGYGIPSPYGNYLAYFDPADGNWYCMNLATEQMVNLTGNTGVNFWDEEDDHPLTGYTPIGTPSWVGADEALLLTDMYDVWKFAPDGSKAENLTRGAGRRDKVQYRVTSLDGRTNPYLYQLLKTQPAKGAIRLISFDTVTKRNGFATVDVVRGGEPQGFLAEKTYTTVTKADNANVVAFLKGDFRNPMDLYITKDYWTTDTKLTSINPQQAQYRWGDVQLVHWNAYDGTPLDGLLFTPDGVQPGDKLPLMIYFYEKYSETLFNYRAPAPSRSTVNISFFVSRGYVVFIPDIVYVDGHPGESAFNCVCSGAESMCRQFSYIDKSKMAIQGQSWGGYQTAYLITRTNMFAAAGAGAPVGNMTSAYGGIRWESGNSRIGQYERGQSRVGTTLWEGLDLYIENSPVFHAPFVHTPVLIMHNDADGAVPWYQGIEFFMNLRRLGKPAWLLEYNNEQHNLSERRNSKDLSIRLSQFFDHYLKGEPLPVWMESGIPYARKGNYFATEYAE